jgi:polysaccharide chain length determinant protein (PEP-CTERM system associated)
MIRRAVGDLTLSGDMMNEVNVLTRVMLSRPNLEETARIANLDLDVTNAEEQEQLIVELTERVGLVKEPAESIFVISFRDSNRHVAETVVKTLLDQFVEDALGERRTDSGAAADFIERQIAEYERRLNDSEKRLADFKRDNIGMMPGDTGDYYTRLQRSMALLEETRGALRLANERRAEYQSQIAGEEPVFGIVAPSRSSDGLGLGGTDALIAQFETDLSTLLLKYTENHPDVIALRETIARLRAQRDEEIPSGAAGFQGSTDGVAPLDTNPVFQSMRIGLSEADVEVATLRSKLAAQEAEVNELRRLVDTIPDIERQLSALNRDYAVTKEQYEQLLQRRESLHITGQVEQTGDQLQFRIIDPPRASINPVGPNRPMFLVGTTLAALGLGCVLALLLQQLNPVFMTRRELRDLVGLPVLGTVSRVQTARERANERRGIVAFGAMAAALPAALALVVVFQGPAHRIIADILSLLPS